MSTISNEEVVEALRQRVDSLELASKQQQKPWHRQPSSVLSAIALLVAVATTVYTQAKSTQETIRSKKEELRRLVIGLVEIRADYIRSLPSPRTSDSQLLKAKQGVYLQAAERLVLQIPKEVSSYEYALLADEHQIDGNFVQAEHYFAKAADIAATPSQRAQALRMLGAAYFSPGPLQNLQKGRLTFEKANESLGNESDAYSIYCRGLNFEAWATMEFQNGFVANADQKAASARKYYNELPPTFPIRKQLVDGLDRRIKSGGSRAGSIGPGSTAPAEVDQALAKLSREDIRTIMENDTSRTLIEPSSDGRENEKDRRYYEQLVDAGLAVFMSTAEVKMINKKDKKHWAYGLRMTALYEKTRAFLFDSVLELVAKPKELQQ